MSILDTKQALIQQLLTVTSSLFNSNDVAYENANFNPEDKDAWVQPFFIPASTDMMGKTSSSGDEQRGIFQLSVFVKLSSGKYDNDQLQIVDDILSAFKYNTSMVYNNQQVAVLSSTVNAGTSNDAWFKRDISINYLTFSTR
jgi:hypothetical protein